MSDEPSKLAGKDQSTTTDRLEAIAKAAESRRSTARWRSKLDGTLDAPEPSDVRSLTTDESAKSEAEASMKRLMEKKGSSKKRYV